MKKRVVLFIKWRSDKGVSMVSQYYVPESFRDFIFQSDFSYVVRYLWSFALGPEIPFCFPYSRLLLLFSIRLASTFRLGWHIEAFSIHKKSLL